jgi:dTDP-4-amino-4,6-dideoxygalactose transaminase
MDRVLQFARRHGLWVVEDVCQAVAAEYRGKKLGSIGDIGCFSFVYTKNMKAYADAGALTTNNSELAERIRRLRDHGRTDKYTHPSFGLNARLGELEAAILRIQLRHNAVRTEGRRNNASRLNERFRDCELGLPIEESYGRHVYHLYVVRSARRDALAAHLSEHGIQTGIHYPIPCHLQQACAAFSKARNSLPHTERAANEILSIPIYPELTPSQLDCIADAIIAFDKR